MLIPGQLLRGQSRAHVVDVVAREYAHDFALNLPKQVPYFTGGFRWCNSERPPFARRSFLYSIVRVSGHLSTASQNSGGGA